MDHEKDAISANSPTVTALLAEHRAHDQHQHRHLHGVVVGIDPKELVCEWLLLLRRGDAIEAAQDVRPLHATVGRWVSYCRRDYGRQWAF